jgi:hypothetical protein
MSLFFSDQARLTIISRFGTTTKLSSNDDITKRIDDSVHMLRTHLDKGHVIYGRSNQYLDLYHWSAHRDRRSLYWL